MSGPSEELLLRAEARLGMTFQRREHLRDALTHASTKPEHGATNERLEFLGDAILGLVVAEHLFNTRPDFEEGRLSKVRAHAVSRRTLAEVARKLGLADCLYVGKMFPTPESIADSVLSNAFEAVIAAVYLDRGYDAACAFALKLVAPALEEAAAAPEARDWKSLFSAYAQARQTPTPVYVVLAAEGKDHEKVFEIAAELAGRRFPSARGRNKREAEQSAARAALRELGEPAD